MRALLRDFESYLCLSGLLIILIAITLLSAWDFNPWMIGAGTTVLVGLLHGAVFWLVRRRQRQLRHEVFNEIQQMLKDLINNQLTVIQTMSSLREINPEEAARACDYITRSVNTISSALHELSEDSLKRWQRQYKKRPPARPSTRT